MAKASTKIRTTIFVEAGVVESLDYMARMEAMNQNANISRTDLINLAIQEFKQRWEKKNGAIPTK